jgi:hypothetical protein
MILCAERFAMPLPDPRTETGLTIEATEDAERVRPGVRVRTLSELRGSVSDSGPDSLVLQLPVRHRTARHNHPQVPGQLTLFANRLDRHLTKRAKTTITTAYGSQPLN